MQRVEEKAKTKEQTREDDSNNEEILDNATTINTNPTTTSASSAPMASGLIPLLRRPVPGNIEVIPLGNSSGKPDQRTLVCVFSNQHFTRTCDEVKYIRMKSVLYMDRKNGRCIYNVFVHFDL